MPGLPHDFAVTLARVIARDSHDDAAKVIAAATQLDDSQLRDFLNLFAARGLIRPLSVDGSRAWFDSNVEPHYHFHDLSTGALIDVPIPAVEFARLPPPPPGTEVAGIDLVIRLRRKM